MSDPLLNLPAQLRALSQWCITPGTADDKAPRTIDGRRASVTDPSTWTDFDTARRAAAARNWLPGFVLTAEDPATCLDFDVRSDTTAEQIAWYQQMVEQFDCYTERSRSGAGFHVWMLGNIGPGFRRDGVEVYSQERFMICTGDVVHDKPMADRQAMLDNMVTQMRPLVEEVELEGPAQPNMLVAGAAEQDQGELGRLWRGDWQGRQYPSQSEADLALVKLLLPKCASASECVATFRLSRLGARQKAARPDYMRRTIRLAAHHLEDHAQHVEHGRQIAQSILATMTASGEVEPHAAVGAADRFHLLLDGDLEKLPAPRWLVKGIIPETGVGAVYGDSGTFKSFLTLDLLAHISNGREWFGRRVTAKPSVYVPFEGQGGVPLRVKAWRLGQAKLRDPQSLLIAAPPPDVLSRVAVIREPMNLRERADRDKLVATLTEQGWAGGVLCIDTLAQAANGIDENSSEMGEMIRIFAELQSRLGGVVLVVHHSGKDQAKGMRGWSGIHAAMDFVVECQRDDKAAGGMGARFVVPKVKDGPDGVSSAFTMQPVVLGFDEDGDAITSLTVNPTLLTEGESDFIGSGPSSKPTKGSTEITPEIVAADDEFIHQWLKKEVLAGRHPSKNSLKGQLTNMQATGYRITQLRIAPAVDRLIAARRVVSEPSPNGNRYLRPIEQSPTVGFASTFGVR